MSEHVAVTITADTSGLRAALDELALLCGSFVMYFPCVHVSVPYKRNARRYGR